MRPGRGFVVEGLLGVVITGLAGCGADVSDETAEARSAAITSESEAPSQCPGTWQMARNLSAYNGLVGSYTRLNPALAGPGELTSLSVFTARTVQAQYVTGSSLRTLNRGNPPVQFGGYVAAPVNPAGGPVMLFGGSGFPTDGSSPTDVYFVLGVQHNLRQRMSALCLQDARVESAAPFVLQRTSF